MGGVLDYLAATVGHIGAAIVALSTPELLLYVVHGTLHLLGFDDQRPEDARAMHKKEDQLLSELGHGFVYQKEQCP